VCIGKGLSTFLQISDLPTGFPYLRTCVENGLAEAQYEYGLMHFNGNFVNLDFIKARE
jgi:TPR repeat protein